MYNISPVLGRQHHRLG